MHHRDAVHERLGGQSSAGDRPRRLSRMRTRQDHVCRFRSDRNSPACMQQTRGSARMQQTREISLVSPVPRENGGPAVFQRVGAPETLGALTRNQIIIRCRFLIGLCEASFLLFVQPFSVLGNFLYPWKLLQWVWCFSLFAARTSFRLGRNICYRRFSQLLGKPWSERCANLCRQLRSQPDSHLSPFAAR